MSADRSKQYNPERNKNYGSRAPRITKTHWSLNPNLSPADKLRKWHITIMMHQRGFTYDDIAGAIGCSRQRVQQIVRDGRLERLEEIENAITLLSVRKHDMVHEDIDLFCMVYTACERYSPDLAKIKAETERDVWRAYFKKNQSSSF